MSLPKEIFGAPINKQLLSQAIRVYQANQKQFTASTKTRGEINLTTAKVYRQKHTGRARHGARSAPIFVGGGIAFGPRPRKVTLGLSQKMKKSALISSLSSKLADKEIIGVSGLEKASGKTKEIVRMMEKISQGNSLIVTGDKLDNVIRGARNIPNVEVLPVNLINAYEILKHQTILITKEAVERLAK